MNTLIIRADASTQIGAGHVMRCIALAEAWQEAGGSVVFLCRDLTPGLEQRLNSEGYTVARINARGGSQADAAETIGFYQAQVAEFIVVDGYDFAPEYQTWLKFAGLRVCWCDDWAPKRRWVADVIVNQNPGFTADDYCDRADRGSLLLGTEFVLLRREFRDSRRKDPTRSTFGNLLITMGGTDPGVHAPMIIQGVIDSRLHHLQIKVIGGNPESKNAVMADASESARFINIEVTPNSVDMAACMAWADLLIIAAGGTLWESLFIGCPTISFARNAGQANILEQLHARGAIINAGSLDDYESADLAATIAELSLNPARLRALAENGRRIVDGEGASRVVREMLNLIL